MLGRLKDIVIFVGGAFSLDMSIIPEGGYNLSEYSVHEKLFQPVSTSLDGGALRLAHWW